MAAVTSYEATDFSQIATKPAPPKIAAAPISAQRQTPKDLPAPAPAKAGGLVWGAVVIGVLYALLRGK